MAKDRRSFSIDEDVASQLSHREDLNASAVVNEFLREYLAAGKAPDAALAMRLEKIEHQLENARSEKSRLESRIERLERERDEVQRQIDSRRGKERQVINETIDRIESGQFPRENIDPENPAIQNWAAEAGLTPSRFVDDLRTELE